MTTALTLAGILAALVGLALAYFRGRSSGQRDAAVTHNAAVDRVRDARVEDAGAVEADAVEAARERYDAQQKRPAVDRANERIARARARRGGGTALVLALGLALPARAEEPCIEGETHVMCTREGFDLLLADADRVELERDEARARADRLDRELDAERDAAKLRVCPPAADPLPWALAGAGVGAAVVAVLVVLFGGGR